MSIPNHILEQLNSQADLISIIGKHTTLKRAGSEYKGCCPFHGEKSPSFYVNPQKNIYHCFGCSVGGNAISFLRDYENLTFIEAVNELSKQTGIEVPKEEQQNVSYQRRTPKPIAPPPVHNVPSPTIEHSKVNQDGANQDGTNQDSYRNNYQNNRQASHQNNVDQSDQNHIDQSSYDDAQGYDNFPPLDAYESAPYSMDSYPSEPYSSNHADDSGYPPVWLTETDAGMDSIGIDQTSDQDGNLYELLEQIQQFYQHNLHTHPHAKQYFLSRGLTEETFETFGLGYAPFGWQHLEHQFPQDIEGLKALGLVRQSESGRDYDLLRDRVIFPIRDNQGRTIGFGGRALDDEVKPKYINSSDSPVFHKQHVLYGYYESRQQRANDWLVVEGYMDVIALYQAGIYGAVASMGTAINESQISRLLTLNPTLTLSFDGDSAGQKAAWRTLEVALPVLADDKELRFLTLPNNHDPDTFIKSHGSDAMREQISQAMPLSQYIFAYLSERYDMSLAEGKAKLMSQVRSLTTALPKGSSFRYLLNNDVYQKLGGRRSQNVEAKDALLDFDGDMTISQQLQLCFLFQPRALIDDPIESIWQQSGLTRLQLPAHIQKKATSDALRAIAWEDLQDAALLNVVTTIKRCMKYLPTDANAAAHFVLSNLDQSHQVTLSSSWGGFYRALTARNVLSLDDLIEELVSSLLERNIKKKMQELIKNPDHIKQAIVRMQAQHLSNWLRAQHAERSSQMVTVQS
ncbi:MULTISPECIES: DNA primase [Psychrobacter]|jgi:DNA primase|uniref:DNA primase n=1 Tax=Psychrobacter pocilloporae TaxID=1775882 RepID=A0ABT6IS18_9GAMM|nr:MULTISPECIES: CHC2 zinc finger domain-containing protein [Psychrobacter]MBZ1391613.1 toprim domain-containing protein [Psychrobacter pacificensis]MDH4904625.1 DNA primase [Psychrobacter pocilloporae]|tara:strand:- start:11978 stop:14203 length:2226 start_codon:yes stop_codon:yes gene_type:complete